MWDSSRPSPSFPFPLPFPLEVGTPIMARGSEGMLKLPQWVRAEPSHQAHSDAFRPNLHLFEYLMQLTDTLSHNIISHKRVTDEPITKAVSK